MREIEGKTVMVRDPSHKKRKDFIIDDPDVIKATQNRISRRVVPEITKIHHFKVTRMERYIVSCYAAEDGGHFRAHRDNTTKGTAHHRFVVSINLNQDFEGVKSASRNMHHAATRRRSGVQSSSRRRFCIRSAR
jgi:hypothetical protein